jgi:cell wall-associated NlpC family hydrolase
MDVIPRWVERYRGIPFVENGHDRNGCNCWGLIVMVMGDRGGPLLDPHSHIGAAQVRAIVRAVNVQAELTSVWLPIARGEQRAMDVVIMTGIGTKLPRHVGIMASSSHLLHIEEGIDFSCVAIDHQMIASRIVSFHRHVALA